MKKNLLTFFVVSSLFSTLIQAKDFDKLMKPFLEQYCLDCHDSDVQKGDLALHNLRSFTVENVDTWKQVWEQVSLLEMPPRKKKNQPGLFKRLEISKYITSELEKVMKGKGEFTDHLHPLKGNHLNHDLLFNTALKNLEPSSSPARLWRIHPQEYLVRLKDLFNKEAEFNPEKPGQHARGDLIVADQKGSKKVFFGADRKGLGISAPISSVKYHGLKNYSHMYTVNGSESAQILDIAEKIVRYMGLGAEERTQEPKFTKKNKDPKKKKKKPIRVNESQRPQTPLSEFMKQETVNSQLLEQSVNYLFQSLTFRPPTKAETGKYLSIVLKTIKELGKQDGFILGLTPIFLDPNALFRPEMVNYGEKDSHGRIMLKGYELELAINSAFSYLAPDAELRTSLQNGKLKTRQDVKREVSRILNDDKIRKPHILQFFREYFDYDLCGDICKDEKTLRKAGGDPEFHYLAMSTMIVNTDRLIEQILAEDKNVLKELLTSNKVIYRDVDGAYFANQEKYLNDLPRKKKDIARYIVSYHKNLFTNKSTKIYTRESKNRSTKSNTLKKGNAPSITTVSNEQRMGILTHPSWLISHSDAMDNHAILRGRWVRERLLGDAVPDVPITVDAMLPDEPHKTLRDRMRVTREDECWRCHKKIDPLGFPFERFNQIGQWRTTEHGKAVDTSGEILLSGETTLDGKVKGPYEMIQKLANSKRVEQVFVRHVFRYWMGRNENINDAPVLRAAHKTYSESGGSMKALLISLLTSDSFLYRRSNN